MANILAISVIFFVKYLKIGASRHHNWVFITIPLKKTDGFRLISKVNVSK